MKSIKIIFRSLFYYKKDLILILFSSIVTAMVLSGVLFTGDSVDFSLKKILDCRLGKVKTAFINFDTLFTEKISTEINKNTKIKSVSVLKTDAFIFHQNKSFQVSFYGVPDKFFELSYSSINFNIPSPGCVFINKELSKKLNAGINDFIAVRIVKPNIIAGDFFENNFKNMTVTVRLKIEKILDERDFGNFNMQASQIPPLNLFASSDWLAEKLKTDKKYNMILFDATDTDLIGDCFNKYISYEDVGLYFSKINGKNIIKNKNIFFNEYLLDLIKLNSQKNPAEVFGYFINSFETGKKSVPYSFAAAFDKSYTNIISDTGIIITKLLAEDLNSKIGDNLKLKYFVLSNDGKLSENETLFVIEKIISVNEEITDTIYMPDFPGITDVENCNDWQSGLPVDLDKIRSSDELYWQKYKYKPKAIININTAKKLWGNRYGASTGLIVDDRYNNYLNNIDFKNCGFIFYNLFNEGNSGINNSVDFKELFFGLSFFLIASSLILTCLILKLYLLKRKEDIRILKTIGFSEMAIFKLLFAEIFYVIFIGSFLGVISGFGVTDVILYFLKNEWNNITATVNLEFYTSMHSVITAFIMSFLTSIFFAAYTLKKIFIQKKLSETMFIPEKFNLKNNVFYFFIFMIFLFIITMYNLSRKGQFYLFFASGILLLASGTVFFKIILFYIVKKSHRLNFLILALRNCSRRIDRTMSLVIILSSSVFLIFTVGLNRLSVENKSLLNGTGGFDYFVKTAVPVKNNSLKNIPAKKVLFRFYEASSADCFNLNQVVKPGVLGANSVDFDNLKYFHFVDENAGWKILDKTYTDELIIPVVADASSIEWIMKKKIGDILYYPGIGGKVWKLKLEAGLKNSLFQGHIIVSEKNFMKMFPGINGSRIILLKNENINDKSEFEELSEYGADIQTATERIGKFNTLQNTYLMIFMQLGILSLFLGLIGIIIIIIRNIFERKNETNWMYNAGFSNFQVFKIYFYENVFIIFYSLALGWLSMAMTAFKGSGN